MEEIPTEINAIAVIVTRENPVKTGLSNRMKDNIIPKILNMAVFPQLRTLNSFKSKEKPNN